MPLPRVFSLDNDVKGMRLDDRTITHEVVALGLEGKSIHLSTEPRELYASSHVGRCQGLIIKVGEQPKLWIHPRLKNRHFHGKIAVSEKSAAMGTSLEIRGLHSMAITVITISMFVAMISIRTGGEQRAKGQAGSKSCVHGSAPSEAAVSRWIRVVNW
ncbi:MAG: hypothetical protein ACO37Y_11400 [Steroidobacteraceae bacterium]